MHTQTVLQKFLQTWQPHHHSRRREALISAVDSVVQGAQVSITEMGRGLFSPVRIKHRVKRVDRLVGNPHLGGERLDYYAAITGCLLKGSPHPVILMDWSDFSTDRQQQLLRASTPVGGRSVTLYEELHPYRLLGNRRIQHRFLDTLKRLLPPDACPIIIADSGFRTPFYRYVNRLGWHWLGRIRNRDYLRWQGSPQDWVPAKSLYRLGTPQAKTLGDALWVRSQPLPGRLVVVRHPARGRHDKTLHGHQRRSNMSRKHAKQAKEPWLLIASPSLQARTAKEIVRLYKTRMQIEENFRDTKSTRVGLGIARQHNTRLERARNLLLIAALASFVLWLIGSIAKHQQWEHWVRVNSSSPHPDYSTLTLARLVIRHHPSARISPNCWKSASTMIEAYFKEMLTQDLWG